MHHPLDQFEILRTVQKSIEARIYNQVRLALKRIANPCQIDLPDHLGLSIILQNDCWICVDTHCNNYPVMVWLDFDTRQHNQAIHKPVHCDLRLYHVQAGLVMGSAVEALGQQLAYKLAKGERGKA